MLAKLYYYLAILGGAVVAVLAFFGMARRAGVKAEQAAETEKALKQAKDSNAIDTDVHNLSQSELDKRLSDAKRD